MADIDDEALYEDEDEFMVIDFDDEESDEVSTKDENEEEAEEVEDEEEETVDLYPLIDSEELNLEDQALYEEYLALTKQIDEQNSKIAEIKKQVKEMDQRPCKTIQEIKNFECLRVSIEQELIKLNMLLMHAMKLQNSGAARWYGDLSISTTLEDDLRLPKPCFQCPSYKARSQLDSWANNDSDDDDDYDDDDDDYVGP